MVVVSRARRNRLLKMKQEGTGKGSNKVVDRRITTRKLEGRERKVSRYGTTLTHSSTTVISTWT